MLERIIRDLGGGRMPFPDAPTAVDITGAARWVIEDSRKTVYDTRAEDAPLVPPWPATWMEYRMPGGMFAHTCTAVGVYLQTMQLATEMSETAIRDDLPSTTLLAMSGLAAAPPALHEHLGPARMARLQRMADVGERAGWAVRGAIYFERTNGDVALPCIFAYLLDTDGRFLDPDTGELRYMLLADPADCESWRTATSIGMGPMHFANALLHCKNVRLEDIPVPPKVAAKRAKKGIPQVTYKTLVVEPMRQQTRRERDDDPAGEQSTVKRALHIARGHFATYTAEAPLFGKVVGTFWKPMHVRGAASAGEVRKNYEVRR